MMTRKESPIEGTEVMIVTMLEATVDPERSSQLVDAFEEAGDFLPAAIVESFLLRQSDSDVWRIVTVWESGESLHEYRRSVDTPGGVLMFRSAGAEPGLTIFEAVARVSHA